MEPTPFETFMTGATTRGGVRRAKGRFYLIGLARIVGLIVGVALVIAFPPLVVPAAVLLVWYVIHYFRAK